MKTKLLKTLLLSAVLLICSDAISQEEPAMPLMDPDMTVRMQVENMMMKDTMMINSPYHKDIQLIQFPSKVLASGKKEVKKYWADYSMSDVQIDYQMREATKVGDTYVASVLKMDHAAQKESQVFIIFQFEGKLIRSIHFVD
ncbi:MAG: hypothetical protein RIC15_11640 [Vicingaceae bacterium]